MGKSNFEQIYDTYYNSLYKYIFTCVKDKWNTEDIISIVFMKIYDNRDNLESVEGSRNWIFKVAHNAVIDFYRKNAKVVPIENFLEQGEEDQAYDDIFTKEEFNKVKVIIEDLPAETKNMIYLRYYGDMKYKDIGEIVNKTDNTVKTIIARAMKKIKASYEKNHGGKAYER